MSVHTALASLQAPGNRPFNYADSFDLVFNSTMAGGTCLVDFISQRSPSVADYITVRTDVILQYERTINELRRELWRYQRFVSQVLSPLENVETHLDARPMPPMSPTAIQVLNSIVDTPLPRSATFFDFQEGEF